MLKGLKNQRCFKTELKKKCSSTFKAVQYDACVLSCVQLFAILWTVARSAPPPMGFSRQEYWSGLPFPSPGDLPDPGIEPGSPTLQADSLLTELQENFPSSDFGFYLFFFSTCFRCKDKLVI